MGVVTAEKFFDGRDLHGPSRIELDTAGTVVSIETHHGTADHHLVCPGFVDLQMNGWDDVDVAGADADDLERLDAMLWSEGTTRWLGTIVTAALGTMATTLDRLAAAQPHIRGMLGVHTEGPFLGGRPGAHDTRLIVGVDDDFVDSLPDSVRLVTLAAESDGAFGAIESLVARGILVSLGHTSPTRQQWDRAVRAGASMVTHLFNGMSGIHHRDGGVALWALADRGVTCGLIADGHHVSDDIVRLAFSAAPGRIVLVSDSVAWRSPWAVSRGLTIDPGVATLPDGTLAGSSTSLRGCVQRAVLAAGVPLADVLRAATSTPAELIGATDTGSIRVGAGADMIVLDDGFEVVERYRATRAD